MRETDRERDQISPDKDIWDKSLLSGSIILCLWQLHARAWYIAQGLSKCWTPSRSAWTTPMIRVWKQRTKTWSALSHLDLYCSMVRHLNYKYTFTYVFSLFYGCIIWINWITLTWTSLNLTPPTFQFLFGAQHAVIQYISSTTYALLKFLESALNNSYTHGEWYGNSRYAGVVLIKYLCSIPYEYLPCWMITSPVCLWTGNMASKISLK